jgi:hypothetical protein
MYEYIRGIDKTNIPKKIAQSDPRKCFAIYAAITAKQAMKNKRYKAAIMGAILDYTQKNAENSDGTAEVMAYVCVGVLVMR